VLIVLLFFLLFFLLLLLLLLLLFLGGFLGSFRGSFLCGFGLGGIGDWGSGFSSLALFLNLDGFCDDGNSMSTLLGDETDEIFDGAVTRVGDGRVFLASGVQFEGGEALDVAVGDVVGGGIAFGNGYFVRVGGIESGELLILGSESLAVSTLVETSDEILNWSFTQGA
jgi:hypothetical protein